ncbi:MAG: DUF4493 domain-containing protein [Cyclobacteriaceae bacterium]
MRNNYLLLSLLLLTFFSCNRNDQEAPKPTDFGYLSMNISVSITEEPAGGRIEEVPTDDWLVTIFKADGTPEITFDPYSSAPAEVQLPTGEYYLEAHSNNLLDAAFDNPYYFGRSANFQIDKEELATIDVNAELANTKVAFNYTQNVLDNFTEWTGDVTVTTTGANLHFEQGETREGYFIIAPLAIDVNLRYDKLDGTSIYRHFEATIDNPQPKTLYNINVDASLEDGEIVLNINVDETFSEEVIELGDATPDPNTNWIAGEDWVDPRDGKIYGTVQIGDQVWMSENLKYLPIIHNNTGFIIQGDNELPGYGVYDYDGVDVSEAIQLVNYQIYGVTYNWYAAMEGEPSSISNPSGVKGACPADWHMPSDSEWFELANHLGGTAIAGGKMKQSGLVYWYSPNTGATNESGFNGLPAGYRLLNGIHTRITNETMWWSSTDTNLSTPGLFRLGWNTEELWRNEGNKKAGFSIRCVKD